MRLPQLGTCNPEVRIFEFKLGGFSLAFSRRAAFEPPSFQAFPPGMAEEILESLPFTEELENERLILWTGQAPRVNETPGTEDYLQAQRREMVRWAELLAEFGASCFNPGNRRDGYSNLICGIVEAMPRPLKDLDILFIEKLAWYLGSGYCYDELDCFIQGSRYKFPLGSDSTSY